MRRVVVVVALCAATVFGLMTAAGAAATGRHATRGVTIDGVHVGRLVAGLGTPSDFEYEYDEVAFVSRVWESHTADGWRVDLSVDVLRGARLSTPARLHDWLIAYEDRPAGEVDYRPTTVRGHRAWLGHDEIFWLLRPGVAVTIALDTARWAHRQLCVMARATRPERLSGAG